MMKNVKRFLSMMLAVSMVFGLLVLPTSAAETHNHAHTEKATTASTKNDIEVEGSITVVPLKTEGVEVDEEDPAIIAVSKELDNMLVLNAEGDPVPLTEEQKQQILVMFQQYLDQWEANAHLLGVQVPFFLQYNDNGEDGLGILGEMLAMAGATVDVVRAGYMTFDDLSGMIMNFYYGDQLGLEYYGDIIAADRNEVLELIKNSGAVTDVQKLLVLNDWLAHNVTFDMPYIMNTDKEENEKPMVAADPQPHEHYQDVFDVIYEVYEPQIKTTFEGNIKNGMKSMMLVEYYKQAIAAVLPDLFTAGAIQEAAKGEDIRKAVTDGYYNEVFNAEKAKLMESEVYDNAYQAEFDSYLDSKCAHELSAAPFVWAPVLDEEGKETGKWTATADVTCAICDRFYDDVEATVEYKTGDPNCTNGTRDLCVATVTIGEFTATEEKVLFAADDALGHDWDEGTVTTPATCKEEGVMTFTCSRCDVTKTEPIAKSEEHIWGEGVVTTPATCKDEGVMTYTCEVCETTKTEPIAKSEEHTWDEGVVTTPATETEPGVMTYTCTVCGETKEDEIPVVHVHSYTAEFTWTEAATGGYTATADVVCECDDVLAEDVPATITDETVAASCKEAGKVTYTATVIVEEVTYTEEKVDVIEKLPHTEETLAAVAATCGADGLTEGKKCTACGEILVAQTVVPATGDHTFTARFTWEKAGTGGYSATADVTCVCGEVAAENVSATITDETVAATCEEAGKVTYTATVVVAEVTYTDEQVDILEKLAHTDANEDAKCDECGADLSASTEGEEIEGGTEGEDPVDATEEGQDIRDAADASAKVVAEQAVEKAAKANAEAAVAALTEEEIQAMAEEAIKNDPDAMAAIDAEVKAQVEKFMADNNDAIEADPVAFVDAQEMFQIAVPVTDEAGNPIVDAEGNPVTMTIAEQLHAGADEFWADCETNGVPGMVAMFAGEIWPAVIEQFYIQGMVQQGMTEEQAAAQAAQVVEADADAIAADPYNYCVEKFGQEGADQAQAVVNDELTKMGIDPSTETNPEGRVDLKIIVALQMDTPQQDPMLQKPDGSYMTPNEAIPVFTQQAAAGLTDGILNYWQGSHIGALGRGTAVCLGYTKAFTYLVQYMNPAIYGVNGESTDMSKAANWKTAEELYYDAEGNLDINANYVVDDVRITFDANVTMYGETQENFNSDHFWNAVKIDGKWYYADPCYTDVYTEVMMRDRVETDGSMNHMYFIFSHSTAAELYSGNYSEIKTLYEEVSTYTDFEDSWISRIKSNTYFDGGYAYYLYDSTDLITLMQDANSEDNNNNADLMNQEYLYKIVRHKLTEKDNGDDGDTNYETLIEFNYKADEDDEESIARVYNVEKDKMIENVLLTKLYAQHEADKEVYPSIALTAALYNGKIYFNLSNTVLSYDIATGKVEIVKEYNTVYGLRDDTNPFGGMAFSVSNSSNYDFVVENHPIAALTIKPDGNLYVSVATNFAFISGKDPHNSEDQSSYGYEFEESNFNSAYNSYQNDRYDDSQYEQFGYEKETNDNDEFMWSANFVEQLSMSHMVGTHTYEEVTVAATCGRDAYTENRCTTCGASEPGTRDVIEDTALAHHYVEFEETYYTKADNGNWNTGRVYVCTVCGFHIEEPTEPDPDADYSMMDTTYEEQKAIYDEQKAIYDEAVATAGHTYEAADAVWAEDSSTVTFSVLECSNVCPDRKNTLDCLLQDDTIRLTLAEKIVAAASVIDSFGTCAEGRTVVYQAAGEVEVEVIEDKPETFAYCFTKNVKQAAKDCDLSTGICPVCGNSNVKRIFGDGRVETAIEAADALKAALDVKKFGTIILANGDNFADALAGSYLATVKDAPILLHRDSGVGDDLNKEYILNNLTEDGIVYVLGGTAAIPASVVTDLTDAGVEIVRLYGDSRFLTNLAILEEAGVEKEEILITTGWNFADCLSASATGKPILMLNTSKNELTAEQVEFLTKYAANNYTIVGGNAAVSDKLEAAIDEIVTGEIVRLSGETREETSVLVAERFFEAPKFAVLAYSRNFPDGLCGGPLAYAMNAPLLLTNSGKEDVTVAYIAENEIKAGYIMGGTAVVAEDTAKVCFGITSELEIPAL